MAAGLIDLETTDARQPMVLDNLSENAWFLAVFCCNFLVVPPCFTLGKLRD